MTISVDFLESKGLVIFIQGANKLYRIIIASLSFISQVDTTELNLFVKFVFYIFSVADRE